MMMTDEEMTELRVRMELWKRYADDPTRHVAEEVEQLIAEVERLRAGYYRVIGAVQAARANIRLEAPYSEHVDNSLLHILDVAREEREGQE